MFISKIKFTKDYLLEVNRESQRLLFKTKKSKVLNHRKTFSGRSFGIRPQRNITKVYDTIEEFKLFTKNESFEFGSITSIIGRNGIGKSTLLNIIKREIKKNSDEFEIEYLEIPKEVICFDANKEDPLVFLTKKMPSVKVGYDFFMNQSYSHGERMTDQLKKIFDYISQNNPCVIMFDQPEQGLDWDNQQFLMKHIKKLADANFQIIIASHSPFIQSLSTHIIDLNTRKNIDVNEYKKDIIKKLENFV